MVSFESVNIPGDFIRHQNFELWIVKNDGSNLFQEDATFRQTLDYVSHPSADPSRSRPRRPPG